MPTESESGAEGGRPRRVRREDVRRRLLATASAVFEERGYEGASLERVAEAAGFSKGAVYSNFANKDELFYELIATRIDERIEAVQAAAARSSAKDSGGPATFARLAGLELREIGAAAPGWQTLFIEFWLRCARNDVLRARLAEKRLLMRDKIAGLAKKWAAESGLALEDSEAMDLATIVLALSNGLGIEGIIDPGAVRPELFGEVLAKIVTDRPSRDASGGTRTS